jgi:hypothetical protein
MNWLTAKRLVLSFGCRVHRAHGQPHEIASGFLANPSANALRALE